MTVKETGGKGVTNVVFAIVVMGLIFLILLGVVYITVSDRLNGLDAYRTKALFDHIKEEHQTCEANTDTLKTLQEWVRQSKAIPPPDLMTSKPCPQPPTTEPKEK